MKKENSNKINRRSFINETSVVAAGWTILPASLFKGFNREMPGSDLNKNRIDTKRLSGKKWWERDPLRIVEFNEGFEFEKKMKLLSELGANMEHLTTFNGTSPGTAFLYNHNLFTGKGVDLDSLGDYLHDAHKKSIKVVIYYNVHAIESSYANKHPDWQQIQVNGKPKEHIYGVDSTFCINSPWREEVFKALKKLASYEIDGIFYDGPIFFSNTCYCDNCKRLFKEKYKKELPSKTKLSSVRAGADWKDLLEFQSDSIVRFLNESYKILKGINPQILLYMNGSPLGPTWPTGRNNRKIIKETDILGAEGGFLYNALTEPIYKPGAAAKMLETQAGGKPTVVFDAAKIGPWARSTLPGGEISILYGETITHQGNVWLAINDKPRFHQKEMGIIKKYNFFIKDNPTPFFRTRSMANIALLWPQNTSNYYAGAPVPLTDFTQKVSSVKAGNLEEAFYGFYDGLSRKHFPFDVLDEESLKDDLNKYDLIILPNASCLSDEEANEIRRFVESGGNIISTFETSRYNEMGEKLDNFQLKDVFGIESKGNIFGPLNYDYVHLADSEHFSLKTIEEKNTYAPTYGLQLKVQKNTRVPVYFSKPLPGDYAGLPEKSEFPFIIDNNFGNGRSIYFAGTFGGSLDKFHFPEYYKIVYNLASGLSKPLIRIENAPSSVEVNVRRNEDSIFLYLINFTSAMVRPIEEIIPCPNLKITLFVKEKVTKLKALWSKKDLKLIQGEGSISFVLPVLEEYEVIELKI